MTLTAELLGETSPYIYNLVYDVDVRLLFIECLDDPSDEEPSLRIVFPEVISYAESNQPDALDDELNLLRRGDIFVGTQPFKDGFFLRINQ